MNLIAQRRARVLLDHIDDLFFEPFDELDEDMENRRQDEEAVAEMEKRGLTVSTVGEPEVALLRAIVDTLTATWRGDRVPADIYDAALTARSAFRAN